jgi:hypothetical protein
MNPPTVTKKIDAPIEHEDGPTRIAPIPPPPIAAGDPPKKKRGRPPGVKNGEGKGAQPAPGAKKVQNAIDSAEELSKQIAIVGAMAEDFSKGSFLEPIAASLSWHSVAHIEELKEGRQKKQIVPSMRVEKASALMFPYLEESGAFNMAKLAPEIQCAIGAGILLAPAIVTGFGMLWQWAMHPKRPAASIVPMQKPKEMKCNTCGGINGHHALCPSLVEGAPAL